MKSLFVAIVGTVLALNAHGQKGTTSQRIVSALKSDIIRQIDAQYRPYKEAALRIWNYAELGYKEEKSSALLQGLLKDAGFTIEAGVAGIPTAFVASYGSGKPVIGILAEYDALPGMSQTADPVKKSAGKNAGHACGHHLFGTGSVAAGIALKELLQEKKLRGTIKVYGCPAEEGGSGKVYMVRAGLFKGVDAALHWHPSDKNSVLTAGALANKSAKFRFHGLSTHAAASPEKGRSALDGVEAMNHMVNMMREHISPEARVHYVITNGGKAPNIVPDFAEVYYYVRHPQKEQAVEIFDRVLKAAEGAALGTGTKMDYEIIGGTHDLLINTTLAEIMHRNFEKVGGVKYSSEEFAYAQRIQSTFEHQFPGIEKVGSVDPIPKTRVIESISTDVGDVSYVVPTGGFFGATWVPGTPLHSWQAVACGGTDIGIKGMIAAAKVMATTAVDLLTQPAILEEAQKEFDNEKGNYQYKALLGDRAPALNYRD